MSPPRLLLRSTTLLAALPLLACVPDDTSDPSNTGESTGAESSTTAVDPCQDCPHLCIDGECVECLTDADCANPEPLCIGQVCEGCSGPTQCPDTAPICITDDCLPCMSDEQCIERDPDFPVCAQTGTCEPCSSSADCPAEYPLCASMQCTVPCEADAWEGSEPFALRNTLDGGAVSGSVCATDPLDRFLLDVPGPAFVALELTSDAQTGNVELALLDPGNVLIDESTGKSGLEVVHVRVPTSGSYEVQVSLSSGAAGAPFKLSYRVLLE